MAPTPPAAPASIEDPPLGGWQLEHPGQPRSKPRPDLGDRSFLPCRTSGADGDDRGNRFDQRHPGPDHPASLVEGADHGVGPVALGLRSPREYEDARDQAPHRRHQHDQPPGRRISDRRGVVLRASVASENGASRPGRDLYMNWSESRKADGPQPGNQPDRRDCRGRLARPPASPTGRPADWNPCLK